MSDYPVKSPRKLIEVALPLDAINAACARETNADAKEALAIIADVFIRVAGGAGAFPSRRTSGMMVTGQRSCSALTARPSRFRC